MDLAPDITPEELELFLEEAEEQLQLLDGGVLRLEREGQATETLQEIFRAVHTLKGSSAMLGFTPLTRLSHVTEGLLDRMRRGALPTSPRVVGALLQSFDTLRRLTGLLTDPDGPRVEVADTMALLREVSCEELATPPQPVPQPSQGGPPPGKLALDERGLRRAHAALVEGKRVRRLSVSLNREISWPAVRFYQILIELEHLGDVIASAPSAEAMDAGAEAGFNLAAVLSTSHDDAAVRRSLTAIPEVVDLEIAPFHTEEAGQTEQAGQTASEPHETPGEAAPRRPGAAQTMRVDVARFDSLADNIGELTIERTRLLRVARMIEARDRDDELARALDASASRIDRTVTELREDARKLRMLPVDMAFNSFPRMMRDLAHKMNKRLSFVIDGQQTEIDRAVVERLRDPLVHLLRNAVDHGIEAPEARKAAGKPEEATIRLSARHEQGSVVVIVRSGDELLALEVDSLLGRQEVLAKPIASYVGDVGHLAGATVLDDGRIAFIADVPSLVARASQRESRAA